MSVGLRPELWLAVMALGAYHGLSPGMGWPLAVANGMWAKKDRAVFATLLPLACGHFLAMAAALLPLSLLLAYVDWSQPVRVAAGGLVAAFGAFKLINRRHPRALARLGPNRLILWSFLVATAHGAGLMLAPVFSVSAPPPAPRPGPLWVTATKPCPI
jgi:threonine/homoserine/homoserine lactone efflux protein